MDAKGAKRISQKYDNVDFTTISSSGHQLTFDNPEEVVDNIIARKLEV